MRNMLLATCVLALAIGGCSSKTPGGAPGKGSGAVTGGNPIIEMVTSKGTIELELFADKAPIGVKNFLAYIDKKQYDGTIFHRVIPDFMIQGGGFSPEMTERPTDAPIKNEAGNGLLNERGTLAYARKPMVDSATCQFFINLKHNVALDHRDDSPQGFGYAVFGKVLKGMEAVDAIAAVPTTTKPPHANVPVEPVVIQSVKVKGK